jgi:hypothetical protein
VQPGNVPDNAFWGRTLPPNDGPMTAEFTDKVRTDDQGLTAETGDQALDLLLHS